MAKSRGRKFAELIAPTNGVFAAASLPTIALSKLASSTFSVNSESASLGGNVELDSNDITEHTSALYFTNARADTRADARIAAHNLLARAGGTMTGNLTLGDNVNVYFGASTDLRIYHDGTNSHIINSTGELRFTGSNFAFKSDSAKLYLGASDDLQIYHDGTHSVIEDAGTGNLILQSNGAQVSLQSTTELYLTAANNGAVTAYHNGSAKLATTSTGVAITGNGDFSGEILVGTQNSRFAENNLRFLSSGHAYLDHSTTGRSFIFRVSNSSSLDTTALTLSSSGYVTISNAFTLPNSDGSANQVLQTNGSGTVSWGSPAGSGTITAVVAGTNLTGGATSGSATVNLAGSLTSISKITFTNSNVQAPTTSDATTGARLVLYTNGSGRDYSIGIESNTMWFNSDDNYKWYRDGNPRMLLEDDVLTFYTASNNVRGYISATETNDAHLTIATSGGEDIAFKDGGIAGTTNFLIRGDGNLYQGAGTNLIWHAGNDGTGSGLDADLVDGIQAASFLRSDTIDSVGTDVYHNYGPNSTWSSTLRVGGNGYTAGQNNVFASVVTTNGNLHLDSGGNKGMYLNYYSGTAGVAFGNGASGAVAWMGPDGDLWKGSGDNTGSKYWHAGNDGSGSGLDADTVDGVQLSSLMRLDTTQTVPDGVRHTYECYGNIATGSSYQSSLEIFNSGAGTDAFLTFHVGSDYAAYLGVDGGINDLAYGGWSAGAVSHRVWHAGNDGSGSGLDADLLDGVQLSNIARTDVHETFGSNVSINGNLYIGSGDNDGYFYSDTNGRTAFAGGNFYIQNSVSNYYNYATNQYLGDNSGDNIYLRGNTMTGNGWSLTGAGVLDLNSVRTPAANADVKLAVWSGTTYGIGMTSGVTLGHLGDYAMTFCMNNDSDRGFWWGYSGQGKSAGAMSLTTGGKLWITNSAQAYSFEGHSNVAGTGNASYHPSGIYSTGTNWLYGTQYLSGYDIHFSGGSIRSIDDIFSDQNYGYGVVGLYSPQVYQHVWSMGSSYRLAANGASSGSGGNLYGLAFSYNPNYGYSGSNAQSKSGLNHQLLLMMNGVTKSAIGNGMWTSGNVTAYSDRRVKTNIEAIPDALSKVGKLSGYTFDRTDIEEDPATGETNPVRQTGVIAQEVLEVLPEAVMGTDEEGYSVAYGNMVGLLIEAIKEQQGQIEDLKQEIQEMKGVK